MKTIIKENKESFICSILSILAASIVLIIYSLTRDEYAVTMYLQILGCGIIPLCVTILFLALKIDLNPSLIITISVFIFLASGLGTGLSFYTKIWFWDLLMHGSFGILCTIFLSHYMIKEENFSSKWKYYVILFLAVLGVAAVWEIFEYGCDCVFHQDAQKVYASMEEGKSPVSDTMEDIMITAVGYGVWLIATEIARAINKNKIQKEENPQE